MLQANQKIVVGTTTLVPNSTPLVVLGGNAVFSNTAYVCSLTMVTGNTSAKLTFNAFAVDRFQAIPSSASDSGLVRYICIGN